MQCRRPQIRSLGREDPLEKDMAPHSSILAWRIPWTEESGGLQSMGSHRVRHDWATNTFTFTLLEERVLPLTKKQTITIKCLKASRLNKIFLENIWFLFLSKESLFLQLFIVTCSVFIEYHSIPKIPTCVGHLLQATTILDAVRTWPCFVFVNTVWRRYDPHYLQMRKNIQNEELAQAPINGES